MTGSARKDPSPSSAQVRPNSRISPTSGRIKPNSIRMNVVLPAPSGQNAVHLALLHLNRDPIHGNEIAVAFVTPTASTARTDTEARWYCGDGRTD